VKRAFDAVADDLAAVSDVSAEMAAVTRQHVEFARLVAVGDQVFAEVPQRPHLADGKLGRPADHEPAGDLPGEGHFHAEPPVTRT
jgi:hypothetical protein